MQVKELPGNQSGHFWTVVDPNKPGILSDCFPFVFVILRLAEKVGRSFAIFRI